MAQIARLTPGERSDLFAVSSAVTQGGLVRERSLAASGAISGAPESCVSGAISWRQPECDPPFKGSPLHVEQARRRHWRRPRAAGEA